ncbi:hypothetical protein [Kitasatospora sp. NPDC085464]|uniref:hypothetical protein n=1 Tax=Kitasatospora sp. NPDC085464 TaxID=3364063 RepID=UPI0037CA4013
MAGLITTATNPTSSEQRSAQFVAAQLPAKWTVVLKDPSGGTGGTGGNTADLAIYTGGSTNNRPDSLNPDDLSEHNQRQPIDIYTPARGATGQSVTATVGGKLRSQAAGGVCVDLSIVPPGSRAAIVATLQKQLVVPPRAVIIVHADTVQLALIGSLTA